jgi:hypothetical protein
MQGGESPPNPILGYSEMLQGHKQEAAFITASLKLHEPLERSLRVTATSVPSIVRMRRATTLLATLFSYSLTLLDRNPAPHTKLFVVAHRAVEFVGAGFERYRQIRAFSGAYLSGLLLFDPVTLDP